MAGSLYEFKDKMVLPVDKVMAWQTDIYHAAGMNAKDAAEVAKNLVTADLRGVYSHGIMRTPTYVKHFKTGNISSTAQPEIVRKVGPTALVDGHNAMGMVVAAWATEKAIEMAREFGSSTVSVTGSNHLGTCAYYAEMAAAADMIGLVWSISAANVMAPWGGVECQLGNNPFAIAVPCGRHRPAVLDMAASVVAKGKISMALKTNSDIPLGWALDRDGNPTTNARAGYDGTLLPMGGYKGYGLAFMNAAMTAIINGSNFGPNMANLSENPHQKCNSGHLIQVIDIGALTDLGEFKKRMDEAVEYIKDGKKAKGVDEILIPGEPEWRCLERQEAEGIAYPGEVVRENGDLGKEYGVEYPFA